MKLYRGLKSAEFTMFDMNLQAELEEAWRAVIVERSRGNFAYPEKLNDRLIWVEKTRRLVYQNFTDDREIAESYARKEKGALIELDVPREDVLSFFTIEFQNFTQRRKKFELVYVVKGSDLSAHADRWKFKLRAF